jgi:amidohydrolase
MNKTLWLFSAGLFALALSGASRASMEVDTKVDAIEQQVIAWRRDFHQHPELSNREFRTAKIVAKHLASLGLKVQTGVAHTGVVAVLEGGKPGPVVALRADMDALPVTEATGLPFASTVRAQYAGQEVGVMHACGHDAHVAILMGVAEILAGMRDDIQGRVKFIFQPAEEGAPIGEEGGAELMVKEGVLENPRVDVAFALHINAQMALNSINYRAGGIMASNDSFRILVRGASTHGSQPWHGVDPIVTASQIVNSLQTIVSRNVPLTQTAAVVTVGAIHGGVRYNIIPEEVELLGTIRAFDPAMRLKIHQLIRTRATNIAQSMGATAEVQVPYSTAYPITYNNADLTAEMLPVIRATAGGKNVRIMDAMAGAEDFSFISEKVPGFYFFLGGKPADVAAENAPAHHRPDFFIDESAFKLGVKTLVNMTLDYQRRHAQ